MCTLVFSRHFEAVWAWVLNWVSKPFLFPLSACCTSSTGKESIMKIKYRFANGEVSEVEVDDELGAVITASRRKEENYERKMRYHCPYSIDKLVYEGEDYADKETPNR